MSVLLLVMLAGGIALGTIGLGAALRLLSWFARGVGMSWLTIVSLAVVAGVGITVGAFWTVHGVAGVLA